MKIQNLESILVNNHNKYKNLALDLFNLDISSNSYPLTLAQWESAIEKNIVYILANNNNIAGVCVWLDNSVIYEMELIQIIISKNYIGKGIASAWLSYLCSAYKKFTLRLEVRKSNAAAQEVYAKCEFDVIGERKNYYPIYNHDKNEIIDREHAVLMEKHIK